MDQSMITAKLQINLVNPKVEQEV